MFKALLVALIGLFFSFLASADTAFKIGGKYYDGSFAQACDSHCSAIGSTRYNISSTKCYCNSGIFSISTVSCSIIPEEELPPSCPPRESTQNFCPDGSIAPNGDLAGCPEYTCEDGQVVENPELCSTPFQCPDGSTPPGNSLSTCPVNCDVLSGGGGPDCDVEEPDGYCGENQSPVFDDCVYGPDDPRNPPEQPDPDEHCELFPESPSCDYELPELPNYPFCTKYPNALECQTPELPDLNTDTGTGTNTPVGPPPEGGTGTGTDTGTPIAPPPAPPPNSSESSSHSTDARLDNLRYDIAKLHSGLNYQTNVIARGLTGVGTQLQVNGAKADRSNTLLDGINRNLDIIGGSLKSDPLVSGNFDVETGINTALGITGNETIGDLVEDPIALEDYTEQYDQFLSVGQTCPQSLPIQLNVMGKNYNIDINYQPACDLFAKLGNFLLFITWMAIPSIVFGRRT